jgi:hypothetical protein
VVVLPNGFVLQINRETTLKRFKGPHSLILYDIKLIPLYDIKENVNPYKDFDVIGAVVSFGLTVNVDFPNYIKIMDDSLRNEEPVSIYMQKLLFEKMGAIMKDDVILFKRVNKREGFEERICYTSASSRFIINPDIPKVAEIIEALNDQVFEDPNVSLDTSKVKG